MFHKINNVLLQEDYIIRVHFAEGVTKLYDLKPWFKDYPLFNKIKNNNHYYDVTIDVGGHGLVWDDDIDLSGEEIFENGKTISSPFDGLMSFGDASTLWGLSESTLRKAISYGKLVEGIDICKFGKQWVISIDSMIREYGKPSN